jgi:class 3 adenylate cyclase
MRADRSPLQRVLFRVDRRFSAGLPHSPGEPIMRLTRRNADISAEPRYDVGTLRKVAALATRLQGQHQETLTAQEIVAVGAEAGLKPAFIRQALAQLTAEQPRPLAAQPSKPEFWSRFAAFTIPLWWGALAAAAGRSDAAVVMILLAPWPLAALLGFLAARKKAGLTAGIELILILNVVLIGIATHGEAGALPLFYFLIGAPLAGGLGWLGASLRERHLPRPLMTPSVSRQGLLNLLFTLQRQLEGQKQRRTFLSVDVVGSSEMKRSAPELAVEHAFGLYRIWMEGVVRAHGGEMESAAGDGVMAIFPTDAGALKAARQLQEELPRFNQAQSHLPQPFHIRCGVSAGEVAIEEGMPLGHLHSPVIDRAAALQKRAAPGDIVVSGEVTATALVELGGLAPLSDPIAGEPAFSWQAGLPANPSLPE